MAAKIRASGPPEPYKARACVTGREDHDEGAKKAVPASLSENDSGKEHRKTSPRQSPRAPIRIAGVLRLSNTAPAHLQSSKRRSARRAVAAASTVQKSLAEVPAGTKNKAAAAAVGKGRRAAASAAASRRSRSIARVTVIMAASR